MEPHGTTTLILKREQYIILASDRLFTEHDKGSEAPTYHGHITKIVLHPRLPLAITTAGMGSFQLGIYPDPSGEIWVAEVLRQEIARIPNVNSLESVSQAEKYCLEFFAPMMRAFGNQVLHSKSEGQNSPVKLACYLAAIVNETSRIYLTVVDEDQTINVKEMNSYLKFNPKFLGDFYVKEFMGGDPNLILGKALSSQSELANLARSVISAGAERERIKMNLGPPFCATEVDLALVDSSGARFI